MMAPATLRRPRNHLGAVPFRQASGCPAPTTGDLSEPAWQLSILVSGSAAASSVRAVPRRGFRYRLNRPES